ncbi:DUF6053 domain-containing protein [Lysobacter enzymogenes]|uniref:DUF6053 domain-containing protein n=1 Tax=Lysobacter enzymogenes TaxID=69 RepID=UPI003747F4AA
MGGPSGPTPSARIAAIRNDRVGPEGSPTKARVIGLHRIGPRPPSSRPWPGKRASLRRPPNPGAPPCAVPSPSCCSPCAPRPLSPRSSPGRWNGRSARKRSAACWSTTTSTRSSGRAWCWCPTGWA